MVNKVEKYEKGRYTYFRINVPQDVVKKHRDLLEKWASGIVRLVVTVEELAGEAKS